MIKICKHFINNLLTFRSLNLFNIYEKLKLINKTTKYLNNLIQIFDYVNKSPILQQKFKNVKYRKYNLNNKKLLTFNT